MKNTFKIAFVYIIAALALMSCNTTQSIAGTETSAQDGGPQISFNVFFQALSPYGRWISYPQYGQVWIPNAGRGFQPYSTNGQWVYSTYGWTWVSDYSWGWAPFHYGRWLFDNAYGWIWVPGEQWAPAWVAWRNSPDYYGWAPLGPGINISLNIGIPAARWIFVPRHYFGSRWAHRYYMPRERNVTIIHNTTIIRNVNVYQNNRYFSGPTRQAVQSATRRTVRPVEIANAQRPGATRVSNRQLSIYRPTVTRTTENSRVAAPQTQTHAPAPANRPQRVTAPQQQQQGSGPQRRVETNRPVRTASPNERTIQNKSNRPANTQNNTPPAPVRNTEQRNAPRSIQRPASNTPTSRRPAVQREVSVQRARQARVQTREVSRQRPSSVNKARPVQRESREYSNVRTAHRR